MRAFLKVSLTVSFVVALLMLSVGPAGAGGAPPLNDWSAWQKYFTPIIPGTVVNGGNPPGRPIPTANPSSALIFAWLNSFVPPPQALVAHDEEVAKGPNHGSVIGHGPAIGPFGNNNGFAAGGELFNVTDALFEPFNNFYGETWRMIPNLWGAYAYQGADIVTFDNENVVKNESPYANGYSMKIAGSNPFEAGISRQIMVKPGAEVRVRVMYALYDHGGTHGGNVWQYDWACLGVKADDTDAVWVNGPWHGQWLPLEYTTKAGPEGRIMIFLQVMSKLPENVNAYFDNVQVWVDGQPFTGS
jgi:hypothetical protein